MYSAPQRSRRNTEGQRQRKWLPSAPKSALPDGQSLKRPTPLVETGCILLSAAYIPSKLSYRP